MQTRRHRVSRIALFLCLLSWVVLAGACDDETTSGNEDTSSGQDSTAGDTGTQPDSDDPDGDGDTNEPGDTSEEDVPGDTNTADLDDTTSSDTGDASDGTAADSSDDMGDGLTEFCASDGPLVITSPDGESVCTGDIAQVAFRFAICSCEDLTTSGSITIDGLDSVQGTSSLESGSLGVNQSIQGGTGLDVGDSIWVKNNLTTTSSVTAGAELRVGDRTSAVGTAITVGTDMYAGDDILAGTLDVAGTLTLPSTAMITAVNQQVGNEVRAPVTVAEPCDCDPSLQLDIPGFIDAHDGTDNENALIGLDSTAYQNISSDETLTLPCGRYYLDGISGAGSLTITLEGRVALFVRGQIALSQPLTINVPDGAQLDLFIDGMLSSAGGLTIGDPARPAATRIYLTNDINLSASADLSANLYMPTGALTLSGELELGGSVFARRISSSNDIVVHYDEAIVNGGINDCTGTFDPTDPPIDPVICTTCRDCANQACGSDGTCGACTDSSECCAPLTCLNGTCTVIN